jgi:endonuclease/exonuclease/phosphatase family metal-dependent hydrolase
MVVVCGDINEWFRFGRPLRWLHRRLGKQVAPATFPAMFPLLALDRIWIEPRTACAKITAHRSQAARLASDHLPLAADVHLPRPGG